MRNHHCIVNCKVQRFCRLQISFIISKSSPWLSCKVVRQSLTITNYQLSHIFTQSQSSSSTIILSHKSHYLTSIDSQYHHQYQVGKCVDMQHACKILMNSGGKPNPCIAKPAKNRVTPPLPFPYCW